MKAPLTALWALGLGVIAVIVATVAGANANMLDAIVHPPVLIRAALVGASASFAILLLSKGLARVAGGSDDVAGLVRGVRLIFVAVAAMTAGAGWALGDALPLVVALVGQTQPGIKCAAIGCTTDYYQGHAVISADGTGGLVYLYDGASVAGGLQTIHASRSTDGGATWSVPVMIESRGSGDVRIAWMETSRGGDVDAWNTRYRRSTDGGRTWSAAVRISDATSGAPYKTVAGYAEVYGDYGEMAITNTGKSIATWGEGINYTGPGGVWVNRER